jgi:hypothetical protein
MIEQPRRQAGPAMAQWFYTICDCGRLLPVTGGIIPEHTYTIEGMYGAAPFQFPCGRSRTKHETTR